MNLLRWLPLFLLLVFSREALAWGEPHHAITRAALEVLPAWEKELLGAELAPLGDSYCLIPDKVYTDRVNGRFAMMDQHPGEIYLVRLHLPDPQQSENFETLRYFIGRAVAALEAGKIGDAARFMGTICHVVEDFGSPAHTIPGDNMFTLLQQFLPPPEHLRGKLLHSLIENGELAVTIDGYQPRLLGTTVDETAWHLLHRIHEAIINARRTTLPIIHALYARDETAKIAGQMKAATIDAQVLADALHTILCLGAKKFASGDEALRSVGLAAHWPLEAVNLYFAQSQFAGSPHWGHARAGVVLEGGTSPVPIRLRLEKNEGVVEQPIADGISVVMGRSLTYFLPTGIFARFSVRAGLQAGLGEKGRVEFTVLGDGKPLASAIVSGREPAHLLECDLTGVSKLQLAATGARDSDPKSNYAIWAQPTLRKQSR